MESLHAMDAGQHFLAQQLLIRVRILARRPSMPYPADHDALLTAPASALCAARLACESGDVAVRSPRRISTIAPKIATDATTTRPVRGSLASSHPSRTATTGFAYVCVATSAGGHRCRSHV